MSNMQLWAGASCIDITPPLGTRINGDFITHFAHSIHDNLFCKALALKSGEETVVIVVVDVCYMQDDFLRPIRKEISQRSGLREENLLFCCTHAHSSGAVCDLLLGAADLPYTRRLPDLIISSVIVALNNLIPAKIAFGSVDVPDHVLCRRYFMRKGYESYNPVTGQPDLIKTNPIGDEDQIVGPVAEMDAELSYIAIKSTNDQWISLLANYSLHYVGDFSAGIISADYFGEFSTQLKTILNAQTAFVGILTNGTSGDANV